jgi:hypothetical protein
MVGGVIVVVVGSQHSLTHLSQTPRENESGNEELGDLHVGGLVSNRVLTFLFL